MKKIKKSTWICSALFLYITVTGILLLPTNYDLSNTEKYVTLGASYVIVVLLWFVLRKKEELQRRRKEEDHYNQLNKESKENQKIN